MFINITSEITFTTSRSSGAGGQNVNKVETAVEGYWNLQASHFFTEEQKKILQEKLSNRINKEGLVQVRSQVHRAQLANKEEVIKKLNQLIAHALIRKKARIATKPTKSSSVKRLDGKRLHSDKKKSRQSFRPNDY